MKQLLYFQSIILSGGVLFSWTNVVAQFSEFHALYGTFFRFKECTIPNPLLTACFYGSVAFVVALVWSIALIGNYTEKSQRYLSYLLIFGVIFALSVLSYEFLEYYHIFSLGGNVVSCSPGTFPLKTPCFYGMLFFLGAAISARVILKQHK